MKEVRKKMAKKKKTTDADVLEQLRQQVKFYRKEYKGLLKQHADINNLVERMREVLSVIEPQGVWTPPKCTRDQEPEEAIALVSDCQLGTKSLGEEIGLTKRMVYGPLGTYNFNVFRYRLRLWLRSVIKITELLRYSIPIRKLNLWFLRDVLENKHLFSLNLH